MQTVMLWKKPSLINTSEMDTIGLMSMWRMNSAVLETNELQLYICNNIQGLQGPQ